MRGWIRKPTSRFSLALLLTLAGATLFAAVFPANNIVFQTSGRARPATIGDWYTSNDTSSTDRIHRFMIEITPAQLAAGGGSITITVQDAESTAGTGPTDEVTGTSDPTRFQLRAANGTTVLQTRTFPSGSANGSTASFTVTAAGTYQLTSETGSTPISGTTTADLNDDDNAFRINVPFSGGTSGGGIGVFQSSFQQDTGGNLTVGLYFLVGPGTTSLQLRNFDIDNCAGCAVTYTRPSGANTAGTISGNGVWNNGGTINSGADTVSGLSTVSGGAPDAGVWRYTLANYSTSNQHSFEANNQAGLRMVAFDVEPVRAGLFTLTSPGTLATAIGTPVDHPFTVLNQFYTNDIINFSLSGTSPNYSVQLLTAAGVPLSDTDGDGNLDTGIMTPQQSSNFILRVTPLTGASSSDNTRISGVSFMDRKVGATSNTVLSIDKTTLLPPTLAKSFSPNPIGVNGISTLTLTLSNVNASATTGVSFSDSYPAGLVNAATPSVTNSCGGTVTGGAGGGSSIGLSGGTIPASGSCAITVRVTSASGGNYRNVTSAVSTGNHGTGAAAEATLQVVAVTPPSVAKAFSASPIAVNGTAVLTLTLTNSGVVNSLNGVTVNDIYPTGLVNAATPAASTNCQGATLTGGTAGGNTIGVSGATVPPASSCTVSVTVTSATAGTYLNSTGTVTSTNGGSGNVASATLVVQNRPTLAKSFAPATINIGDPSLMTITLSNSNSTAMTAAAFTDTYPAGLVNSSSPNASTTCGGTVTAVAGGGSLSLSGGTIPAGGSCTVTANVTRNTAGSSVNTIPAGGLTTTGGLSNAAAASATLTAQALSPPTLSKSFSVSPIQAGGRSTLRLTIANPNPTATLTDVAFNDAYPANLVNDNPAGTSFICTAGSAGNLTGGVAGGTAIGFTDGNLLPGGNCVLTVNVTSAVAGTYNNSTTAPTSSNGGTGTAASAALVVQATPAPLKITKAFGTASTGVGMSIPLTISIANPNAVAAAGVAFTDVFPPNAPSSGPGSITVASPLTTSNTCGGTLQDSAGGALAAGDVGIRLTGGAIAVDTTCTITVNVVASNDGSYTNTTSTVTATGLAAGAAASAPLTVVRPTVSKSFSPTTIAGGGTSTLTITLGNASVVPLTAAGFSDLFPPSAPSSGPGAMTVASPLTASTTCSSSALLDAAGGTLTAGDTGIRLTNGTIPPEGTCTVTVNVTASVSGSYTNTLGVGAVTSSGGSNTAAASASLSVLAAPTLSKSFSPSTIIPGGSSTLTVTLANSNAVPASAATVIDNLPTGLAIAGVPTTSCGGTVTADAGSVSLNGGTIPAGSSCTVTVTVTGSAPGSYLNTLPVGALSSSAGSNTVAASATLVIQAVPSLVVTKTLQILSDPANGTSNPKFIPGALGVYTVTVTNTGSGSPDANSLTITDPIPTGTALFVGDVGAAGSGPVAFVQGSPTSSLTYSFSSLSSQTDDVGFSGNGGASYSYVPTVDANGVDNSVTHLLISPKGSFAAAGAGGSPSFQVRFRVRVR